MTSQGDHMAAIKTAIVQQRAARLADEEPGVSLKQKFVSLAMEFLQVKKTGKAL